MAWPCNECVFPMEKDVFYHFDPAQGFTPLMMAAMQGHVECVHVWIESGADVNAIDSNGCTALLEATSHNPVTIQMLLEAGADPNVSDQDRIAPLHHAARYGHESIAQKLLQAGADVNVINKWGNTPLIIAAYSGALPCIQTLLEAGADVNLSTPKGETAYFTAATRGHGKCMERLKETAADVNVRNNLGRTPLYYAAIEGLHTAVKVLLESGADVNAVDSCGVSPLLYLADETNECDDTPVTGIDNEWYRPRDTAELKVGQRECMNILLEAGADVDVSNDEGKNALFLAIDRKRDDFMKLLLQSGADPVKSDTNSGFPLGLENLEKWEGIFQSGKSQGILNRLEKSGKITQNTGKIREFEINIFNDI